MPVGGAHAVAAGVAAADHDHVLAGGHDLAIDPVARVDAVLLGQELHREVDALQFAAGHRQVARLLGTAREDHGVELGLQLLGRDGLARQVGHARGGRGLAHEHAGAEDHAFGLHLLDATVDVALLHLEVGDAVAQQAPDTVVLLEHRHVMADPGQLLRGRHPRGTGAHHGHALAGLGLGRLRHHPALFPPLVDDRVLDRLDADGVGIDVQRAGRLARRGADAAGELGEVVGRVQRVERGLPVLAEHQVVEVRNDVVDRAAALAERDAAIHAARALHLGLVVAQAHDELAPVLEPRGRGLGGFLQPLELQESSDLAHRLVRVSVGYGIRRRPARGGCPARRWRHAPRRPARAAPVGTRSA